MPSPAVTRSTRCRPDAMTALTELQGEERAVAQVAFDCEEEFLTPVEELIQRELYARPVQ